MMGKVNAVIGSEVEVRDGNVKSFDLTGRFTDLQFGHIPAAGKLDPAGGSDDLFNIDGRTASRTAQRRAVRNGAAPVAGVAPAGGGNRRGCTHVGLLFRRMMHVHGLNTDAPGPD